MISSLHEALYVKEGNKWASTDGISAINELKELLKAHDLYKEDDEENNPYTISALIDRAEMRFRIILEEFRGPTT